MVNVTFRHMEGSESLQEYAVEKVEKASKFLYEAYDAQVVLSVEKYWQVAEIVINGEGHTVVGSARMENMYAAIDSAMDKVTEQLRRNKDRFHVPQRSNTDPPASPAQDPPEV